MIKNVVGGDSNDRDDNNYCRFENENVCQSCCPDAKIL